MANLLTATAGVVTVDPYRAGGSATTTLGANNYKNVISQSDAGTTLIVSVAKSGGITDANLNSIINNYMTVAHGVAGTGDSAFTVAGIGTADGTPFVAGSTETVYLRLQGTGDLTVADADLSISGYAVALVAVFKPAK
jgi:hypothetical protein